MADAWRHTPAAMLDARHTATRSTGRTGRSYRSDRSEFGVLHSASSTTGRAHGARSLKLSAAFFALPVDEKVRTRQAEGTVAPVPAGYAPQPAHSADKNEYVLVFDPKLGFNVYPSEPAGFRSVEIPVHMSKTIVHQDL